MRQPAVSEQIAVVDPEGETDNIGVGQHTEAVGYAATEFTSRAARDAEVRIGCYTVVLC